MTKKRLQPGQVEIPKSELGSLLEEAAAIKANMSKLLSDLEKAATGHNTGKPGGWRRDPTSWRKLHKLP